MISTLGGVIVAFVFLAILTSLVTITLYWWDKRAARQNRRRVAEQTLHLWALAGGWPGALFARARFRHKTQKQPFGSILWCTVAVNLAAWALFGWLVSA
jgi:uncharacterized membrane protein YsdA (DUF1294 family)